MISIKIFSCGFGIKDAGLNQAVVAYTLKTSTQETEGKRATEKKKMQD